MARILVIDDDEAFRPMVKQMLEQAGHEVLEAANGKEGVKLYNAEAPDLVITDLIMPEQEGIETILGLVKENPDAPVIAMSGGGRFTGIDVLSSARKFGAKQALAKLKSLGSAQTRKTCGRHGVTGDMFGVKYGDLNELVLQIKVDHELARPAKASKKKAAKKKTAARKGAAVKKKARKRVSAR